MYLVLCAKTAKKLAFFTYTFSMMNCELKRIQFFTFAANSNLQLFSYFHPFNCKCCSRGIVYVHKL
jgi:hypothetical protein